MHSLQVIDCRIKDVVVATPECKYVTLSYVWGKSHSTTSRSLTDWDEVPVLIQDALAATVRLGFDFLWVDFYCIPQNDQALKQSHIRNMDKIYSEAQAVIVAACSANASVGLSGVSTNARLQSLVAVVGNSTLVVLHSNEVSSVENASETRGAGRKLQCTHLG